VCEKKTLATNHRMKKLCPKENGYHEENSQPFYSGIER
jgi:hypothetical protein